MNNRLIKLLLGSLIIGLPVFATVEAKADNHMDMPHSEMEMKEDSGSLDGGTDGEPVVTIPETEGTVSVIVKNNTNVAIDYQAIGFTENQTLEGGEAQELQDLPVPVVIRAARQDDGFVTTEPMINDDGVLEVTMDEAGERNLGVVRIEEDGGVYISDDSEVGMDSESGMPSSI